MYFLFIVLLCSTFFRNPSATPCTTPNGIKGNCISIYNCSELLTTLETLNTSQIQFVQRSQCGYDKNPLVCCPEKNLESKRTKNAQDLLPSRQYCGYQHTDDYIAEEKTRLKANIDEFPWLASLLYLDKANITQLLCSGVLINQRYVLTTAQCIRKTISEPYGVRLGEYNIEQARDCADNSQFEDCTDPIAEYSIVEALVHPEYSGIAKTNDIALLRLNRTVHYSDFIRPICLPLPGIKLAQVGENLSFSGWGKSTYEGKQVIIKKKGLTELVSHEECVRKYKNRLRPVNITSGHKCTIIKNISADVSCQGDGGGPLMFANRNQWHVESLISFGIRCGSGFPDVSTNVISYLDWILENLKP